MEGFRQQPSLIEPGVSYFLKHTLKNNHKQKIKAKTAVYNMSLFAVFIALGGLFTLYKVKMKPEVDEKKRRSAATRQYLIAQMTKKHSRHQNPHQNQGMITNLPRFKSDFEVLHENFHNI